MNKLNYLLTGALLLATFCILLYWYRDRQRVSNYCPTETLFQALTLGTAFPREKIDSGLREVAQKCRTGDIIAIPSTLSGGIGQLCDFSKQIATGLFLTGNVTLCVYVGEIRFIIP